MYSHGSTRLPTKATRRFPQTAIALAVAALAIGPTIHGQIDPPDISAWPHCYKRYEFFNTNRRLTGAVNAECYKGPFGHSAPFGNWGVVAPYTPLYDGFQFPGWKWLGGWRQWNSCTTNVQEYEAPSGCWVYYNDGKTTGNLCYTQKSTNQALYAKSTTTYYHVAGTPEYACTSIVSGAVVFNNLYMHIYELDSWVFNPLNGDSDEVTKLRYPTVSVPITCNSSSDTCTGSSGWYAHNWSKVPATGVTAKIKASVSVWPAS